MALDDATRDGILGLLEALEKKIDLSNESMATERRESARRFEIHGEAIALRNERTIKEEIGQLGTRLDEKIGLLFQAKTAEQCADIESISKHVEGIQIQVDGIDTRTRDYPLVKGKVEQLETRPGQWAIKAWQKVAIGAGALAIAAINLIPFIFPKK